jgi:hypothetical protein
MDLLTDHLAEARRAYRRGDWSASHAAFSRADGMGPLALDDAEAFATVAWRLGHAAEAVRLAERVYGRMVRTDPAAASMEAVGLARLWLTRGDVNVGRSWLDRARRSLAGTAVGPANGYLGYLEAVVALREGDAERLEGQAAAVRDVADRFADATLVPLAAVIAAVDAFRGGRIEQGHALVERVLPTVESGALSVEWAGDAYGLLLHVSRGLGDPSRTSPWMSSMQRWCERHDAPLYHRVLAVYRGGTEGELLATSSALQDVHGLAAGEGFYRLGELRRLRGDAAGAAAAFATARRLGVG